MPESRLERTRAAYRPKPKGAFVLAMDPDAFTKAFEPHVEQFNIADMYPQLFDVLTGKGRYFPNEEERQRAALVKLAGWYPYSVRILNP